MSSFTSFTIGQVDTPVNIIKEFLAKFSKQQKCKAAILSWLDGKHFYGHEWIRATFEEIAEILGYHRDTISRHVSELLSLEIVASLPANKFPKDTAYKYQLNTDKLLELVGIERCGKTDIDMPDNQHINAENPATYINPLQNNLKNFSLETKASEEEIHASDTHETVADERNSFSESQPENLDPLKDKSSAACTEVPKKRTNGQTEVWEIAPGHPYPVFLNWRADKHYKPQGGKWESDAYGIAYAEFYNNRAKTTAVLFPQFLEYMKTAAENCNQQVVNGIKAILPSCFISRPEASQENVQQLMANIQQLVESGVQVALPNPGAPSSTQSMSWTDAAQGVSIKPLPILQQPILAVSDKNAATDGEVEPLGSVASIVAQSETKPLPNPALEAMRGIFKTQLKWEIDDTRLQWFLGIQQPERSLFWNKLKAQSKKASVTAAEVFDNLRRIAETEEEEKEITRAVAWCWLLSMGLKQ